MNAKDTAIILIGYQNDYFSDDGVLHPVVVEALKVTNCLDNTLQLLDSVKDTGVFVVATPILFTDQYSELRDPVGILKVIREVGAFREGTFGGETIPEIKAFGDLITYVPGKRGLNAFSNTRLSEVLLSRGICNVVIAGVVTPICIDSTGRSAFEQGYKVYILSDCTAAKNIFDQNFYIKNVFPLYAEVITRTDLVERLASNS